MDIFHYVADQLKDVSLFESNMMDKTQKNSGRIGAIYNDFDKESPFQNTSPMSLEPTSSGSRFATDLVNEEDIDHALLEADREESIFYEAYFTSIRAVLKLKISTIVYLYPTRIITKRWLSYS